MCQILFCWGELCDCDVLAGAGKALGLSWFKIRGGVRHIRVVLSVMSDRVNFGRAAARNPRSYFPVEHRSSVSGRS